MTPAGSSDPPPDSAESAPEFEAPPLLPLIKVVGYKRAILRLRYPVDTASLFLSMLVFFVLVFFGGEAVAGTAVTDSAEGIVVGFFLWTLATRAFRGLADDVTAEAQWGTLERLFLSPYGVGRVVAVKTVVGVGFALVWSGAMLVATMLVTGYWLPVDLLTIAPLVVVTITSVVGVGYALGGLGLLYKRIESVFGIVTFGFVALIAAPVAEYPALKLLPVAQGSHLVRTAIEDGVRLWQFPASELALLVLPSTAYLLAGWYCFHRAQRLARVRGSLGDY